MYKVFKIFTVITIAIQLSGCLVAAAGAGAGGMYTADHYTLTKKDNQNQKTSN